MLGFTVSNPGRPDSDSALARAAVKLGDTILNEFGASQMLSCRAWAVYGWLLIY